jgi:hypothetical protein
MAEGTVIVWDRYGEVWQADAETGDNSITFTRLEPEPGKRMTLERLELAFWFERDDVGALLALINRPPRKVNGAR